jgi:alanine racemase
MRLIRFLRKIQRRFIHYSPSVKIFISRKKIKHNLQKYQKKYPQKLFAPVLKSNAYGHGLIPVAQILDQEKIAFFVLDSLYEAIILRKNGIKSKILIIGYTLLENIIHSKLSLVSFTITSLEQLKRVSKKANKKIKIHLKIDTGMHRQGILLNQVKEAIKIIKANSFLELEGICSHFAEADNPDKTFTKSQIKKWEEIVSLFKKNFSLIKFFHISATAGTFYSPQISENVIRLGIGLYGINPSPLNKLDLKPALEMESLITSLRKLPPGEYIGYQTSYQTQKSCLIATVPVGYFEGVDRRLSNQGFFKIGSHFCPIVGRVSMNITSLDVSSLPEIKLNDKVKIISSNPNDKNSIENIAYLSQTIPYEILVHLPPHLRRSIIN